MSRGVSSAGLLRVSMLTLLLTGATGASSVEASQPSAQQRGRPPKEGGEVR
jgi:hypothetical protein